MRSRLVLLAALALMLGLAPGASAKGPIDVCGASGCIELGPEGQPAVRLFSVDGDTATVAAPAPAPYFVIRFGADPRSSALGYWIPSASLLRVQGQPWRWIAALPEERELLTRLTAGLTAYTPPERPAVYVDYNRVKRSDGYLRLVSMGMPVSAPVAAGGWLEVWFMGARSSPWTDGTTSLEISRRGGYLKRDGRVFRISTAIARRVRARLPLS